MAVRVFSGDCRGLPCRIVHRPFDQGATMFQTSFLTLAVVLTMSGPPIRAAALTAAESTWLAAAAPVLAFARAQHLHLSSAHKG